MTSEVNQKKSQKQLKDNANKNLNGMKYISLDYSTLRNLKGNSLLTDGEEIKLLPGLGLRNKISLRRKELVEQPKLMEEPRLLSTAKKRIQQHVSEMQSDSQVSNLLGLSSFLNSREVTPINPLNNTVNRKKNIASQKNKLNSINSQLFDIQSNPEEHQNVQSKFKHSDFRIYDKVIGQSELVYQYVFGKEKAVNPKIIHLWKDCLHHQDKIQIYLPVNDNATQIPYSNSRIYPLNQIEKGFKEIYGVGKNRSLKIGQEAIILDGISRYLTICSRDALKISRKDFDIIENILTDCKMLELQNHPMCIKQIETHFRLMATKWKYSGILNMTDKIVESALIMGKNNFLDLNKNNILTNFLLKNSNINEI